MNKLPNLPIQIVVPETMYRISMHLLGSLLRPVLALHRLLLGAPSPLSMSWAI